MSAREYDDLTVPRDNLAAIEVVEFLNRVAVRNPIRPFLLVMNGRDA